MAQTSQGQGSSASFCLWDVQGTFIIPGTREKVSFGPIRIGAFTQVQASADLAKILNDKFKRSLRGEHKFNRDFAMAQLQWQAMIKAMGQAAVTALQEEIHATALP